MQAEPLGLLALVGALIGLLSGLFGVGGGFLLVPVLSLLGWPIKQAIGTSLFFVTIVGVGGAIQHLRAKNVDLPFVATSAVASVVGAPLGAVGANRLPEGVLLLAFGVFLGAVALTTGRSPAEQPEPAPRPRPMPTLALGLLVGVLSGVFGVGGGLLFVPAQVAWFKLPIKRAVGNSLAGVVLTGLSGLASHLWLGHVAVGSGLVLGLGGLAGLQGGTRLLRQAQSAWLKRGLVGFLLLVAIDMGYRGLVALR